jgi:hypothetical protein
VGTHWSERQINETYKAMFASRSWSDDVLREALRQTWIAWYGRPTSGPTLGDLQAAGPPGEQVKYLRRRVAKNTKPL